MRRSSASACFGSIRIEDWADCRTKAKGAEAESLWTTVLHLGGGGGLMKDTGQTIGEREATRVGLGRQ
jgi:hypothetical protein